MQFVLLERIVNVTVVISIWETGEGVGVKLELRQCRDLASRKLTLNSIPAGPPSNILFKNY